MSVDPVLPVVLVLLVAACCAAVRIPPLLAALRIDQPQARRVALVRWSALSAAVAVILLAAVRPAVDTGGLSEVAGDGPAPADNVNVYLVVDRSVNSRVADLPGGRTRMSAIRADIAGVIAAYPGARFALIGFAAQPAVEWPLSEDAWSLDAVVSGLSAYPQSPPADRVDTGAAAIPLRYRLIQAAQQYPGSTNLVFYFGSGAAGSGASQGSFADCRPLAGGAVFGYGSVAGGPIPSGYVDGALAYAGDARSVLDESRLRRIAAELGVPYIARDGRSPLGDALPAVPDGTASESVTAARADRRVELYWLLAGLGAILLLPEIWWSVREFRARHREGW